MIVGLVLSMIVNVAVVEELFPQLSVAVKVTVAEPVAPHVSENEVKLLLQVTLANIYIMLSILKIQGQLQQKI